VDERPDRTLLLRLVGHRLEIFLRLYSAHPDADDEELKDKIHTYEKTLTFRSYSRSMDHSLARSFDGLAKHCSKARS
jgi:hypothetical protein